MKRLYILYDAECGFCRQCRAWLERQPAFVPLSFIPLQSPEIGCRFPGIEKFHPETEIVAVSDRGELWQGGSAWVMGLWALREYREWSQRLAHPALLPFARRACAIVSENRHRISKWFTHTSLEKEELRRRLGTLPEPGCASGSRCHRP